MTMVNNIGGIGSTLSRITQLEQMSQPQQSSFANVLGSVSSGAGAAGVLGGSEVTSAPPNTVESALEWGRTQIGTPYAGVVKFRMGDVPWDGKAHPSMTGSGQIYQYPAGTKVYDCSGFATQVWRRGGVDLAQFNATTSASMLANIPQVDRSQAQAGDLVILDSNFDGRSDHVGVLDESGMMLDCQPTGGVQQRKVDWSKALGVVRPSLLVPQNTMQPNMSAGAAQSLPALTRFGFPA